MLTSNCCQSYALCSNVFPSIQFTCQPILRLEWANYEFRQFYPNNSSFWTKYFPFSWLPCLGPGPPGRLPEEAKLIWLFNKIWMHWLSFLGALMFSFHLPWSWSWSASSLGNCSHHPGNLSTEVWWWHQARGADSDCCFFYTVCIGLIKHLLKTSYRANCRTSCRTCCRT